jgi:hypothetical protein
MGGDPKTALTHGCAGSNLGVLQRRTRETPGAKLLAS